jgi:hypothetical protein
MAQEYDDVAWRESRSDGERISEGTHSRAVSPQPRPPGLPAMSAPAGSEISISGLEWETSNRALIDGSQAGLDDQREHLRPTHDEFRLRLKGSAVSYLTRYLDSEVSRSVNFQQLMKIYESSYEQGYFEALGRESPEEREAWFLLSDEPANPAMRAKRDKIADLHQNQEKNGPALWFRGLQRALADLLPQGQENAEQYAGRLGEYIALYEQSYRKHQPDQRPGQQVASEASTPSAEVPFRNHTESGFS